MVRFCAVALCSAAILAALGGVSEAARVSEVRPLPAEVVYGSDSNLELRLKVEGRGELTLRIEIVRRGNGRIVKGFRRQLRLPERRAGKRSLRQVWAGRTWAGQVAPVGGYAVRVRWMGRQRSKVIGRFRFRTHLPPVTGQTGSRGYIGEFGAPRSGGRTHEGFDILAPCGRKLVVARAGRVSEVGYDPVLYGYYVRIQGFSEDYSYFYSHLIAPSPLRRGQSVRTGDFVGRVGQTGNAATTPCHLHFQVERDGQPLDPLPFLRVWSG